jgi:hypothetical protein
MALWGWLTIGVDIIEPKTPPLEMVKVPPAMSSSARFPAHVSMREQSIRQETSIRQECLTSASFLRLLRRQYIGTSKASKVSTCCGFEAEVVDAALYVGEAHVLHIPQHLPPYVTIREDRCMWGKTSSRDHLPELSRSSPRALEIISP